MSSSEGIKNHAAFIWSVADLLRGTYKQSEYGRVILPLTVLRRMDCVLEATRARVFEQQARYQGKADSLDPILKAAAGQAVYNTSAFDLRRVLDDPTNVAGHLRSYVAGFSPVARDVVDKFDFDNQIDRLDQAKLLYLVVSRFAEIDLHPATVSNLEMGYLYEELIRRFSELSNETAGEHFTPREVIRLMVNLLFIGDDELLTKPGIVKTLFDPACGTGGMLSIAEEYLREHNPQATLRVYGQELNAETYAICQSDLLLKGETSSLKTIAAFLNAELGGTVLIGVSNDGTVHGLASDYASLHRDGKDDRDLFQLHLGNIMVRSFGSAAAANVTAQIHTIDGRDVCRVQVRPSGFPVEATVTVDRKGQQERRVAFYARIGNATRELDGDERQKYVAARWPS